MPPHRSCEIPFALLTEWIATGYPLVAELARLHFGEYVDLPAGHWLQFTRPAELGAAILAGVGRTA
ncbi:hypothetical protein [Cryobacterium sp. TMT2-42-4]|uniref:hypothetical protein n=1 Tax=Cryobacterium sp. TMT2-42-4 TaxID=1259255 RepID=UPI0010699504|nr:hypothetical protein E3O18_08780 [Cryobacterium sp. TMT2-42-4]